MIDRIVHFGFNVRLELVGADGERLSVQTTRDHAELNEFAPGPDRLRQAHAAHDVHLGAPGAILRATPGAARRMAASHADAVRSRRWLAAGALGSRGDASWPEFLVVGALLAAGFAGYWLAEDRDSSTSSASTTATPDQQAAGGPLVGDPTLVASEETCVKGEANAPWYPTMAAFEVHDSARTHLYACAHFLGSASGANEVLAYSSTAVYETP